MADQRGREAEHDMQMSGANSDGTYFQQCRCGWRSTRCGDPRAANIELIEHARGFGEGDSPS